VLTQTGAILGTPGYLAPEQATGKPGAVTVATDVYGLGAILYELLTGEAPFSGPTPLDALRRVLEEPPVIPRSLNSSCPIDLQTICLKCLEKEPARRYPSAQELADDLGRFLEGRPIQARPVGPVARLWRWACRQPVVAGLTFSLFVSLVAGLGLVTWFWRQSQHSYEQSEERGRKVMELLAQTAKQEHEAKQLAVTAQLNFEQSETRGRKILEQEHEAKQLAAEADASFHLAHDVVGDFCFRLSEAMEEIPGLQPRGKELLEKALGYYQQFQEKRGNDPRLRRELADVQLRIARLYWSLGQRKESIAAYEQALAFYRELHEKEPDNLVWQRKVAGIVGDLATVQPTSDDRYRVLLEAKALYEKFRKRNRDNPELMAGLSTVLNNLGTHLTERGQRPEAHTSYEQAIALAEALYKRFDDDAALNDLASPLYNLAVLCSREADGLDEAIRLMRRSLELREKLADRKPHDPRRLSHLATTENALGVFLREAKKYDEARLPLERSLKVRQKLVDENPHVRSFKAELAAGYRDIGFNWRLANDKVKALEFYGKARDLYDELVKADPRHRGYRSELGLSWYNIGAVLGVLDRRPEEKAAFLEAVKWQRQIVKEDPENVHNRHQLGRSLNNLGFNLAHTGHPDEAVPILEEAVACQRLAHTKAPQVPGYYQSLTISYNALVDAERQRGGLARAVTIQDERQKLYAGKSADLYFTALEYARTAELIAKGRAEPTPEELDVFRTCQDRALEALRQAHAAGFTDAQRMRTSPVLEFLRGRPEFEALARRMEQNTPAKP
jgi:tetratricopeptide (TPR) repeat protein